MHTYIRDGTLDEFLAVPLVELDGDQDDAQEYLLRFLLHIDADGGNAQLISNAELHAALRGDANLDLPVGSARGTLQLA